MRHVPIKSLLKTIFSDRPGKTTKQRLDIAHKTVTTQRPKDRKAYIDNNGATKWSPLKNRFTAILGNKCWYTEVELVGAPLTIDHYRPRYPYWFLAFKPDNYRVACPFANSPKHNPLHGCAGGKAEKFPLLDPSKKATGIRSIKHERPVILDPCNEDDCKLIAFQSDGRPLLHPDYQADAIAQHRVDRSNILLNIDHPDLNSKREQLRKDIERDVRSHENSAHDPDHQRELRGSLSTKVKKTAPFSIAARQYLSAYKYIDWVEDLLNQNLS
jgi:hypothetical protein